MHSLFLSLLLLMQGIPIQAQQGGTLTGILRDAAGRPAPGVRVAAVAVPDSPVDAQTSTAMGAIAETDATGQYRLENVPPGRYYIAAGRLDLPTYFPGTQQMTKGTVVAVTAGSNSPQINFTLQDSSSGRALIGSNSSYPAVLLPIDWRLEDGRKAPVFGPAGFVSVVMEPAKGGTRTSLSSDVRLAWIPGPGPLDYRIAIENLPPGYSVKSIAYDGAELRSGALHLDAARFSSTATIYAATPTGATALVMVFLSPPSPIITPVSTAGPPPPTSATGPPLVITLVRSAVARPGVQIRGTLTGSPMRSIYLSGNPGILFSDGTFEFRDVPPGRHSIITLKGSPLAASVVVGTSDVDAVQLQSTPALPVGILEAVPPAPAGTNAPGVLPLASLRVTARNQDTQDPLVTGMAFLTGGAYGGSRPLNEDGTFEFSPLLPGTYNVEIQSFGFETVKRSVAIGEASVDLRIDAVPAAR